MIAAATLSSLMSDKAAAIQPDTVAHLFPIFHSNVEDTSCFDQFDFRHLFHCVGVLLVRVSC